MDDDLLDRLITAAASGDQAAFDQVVTGLGWRLRLWLAARCPPEIDPDEVAHLTLVHAYRIAGTYAPGTQARAWIWAIARNQLRAQITALRRTQAHQAQYLPEAVRAALARQTADHPEADDAEVAALRRCLEQLPATTRSLLDGFYGDDQPLAALAAQVQRSTGAVKKQLCLVRQALRTCIERRLATADGHG
jgi:RNA polymerase sigma-70 factor (ECF subfamily)